MVIEQVEYKGVKYDVLEQYDNIVVIEVDGKICELYIQDVTIIKQSNNFNMTYDNDDIIIDY